MKNTFSFNYQKAPRRRKQKTQQMGSIPTSSETPITSQSLEHSGETPTCSQGVNRPRFAVTKVAPTETAKALKCAMT